MKISLHSHPDYAFPPLPVPSLTYLIGYLPWLDPKAGILLSTSAFVFAILSAGKPTPIPPQSQLPTTPPARIVTGKSERCGACKVQVLPASEQHCIPPPSYVYHFPGVLLPAPTSEPSPGLMGSRAIIPKCSQILPGFLNLTVTVGTQPEP